MIKIVDSNKISILINVLNERYSSSHKMRDRSQSFFVWIIGIGFAFISIILGNNLSFNMEDKIFLTLFIIVLGILVNKFLNSIHVGFNKNRKVMIDVEKALCLYKNNIFLKDNSIYPIEYSDLESNKNTSHFKDIYSWIQTIGILLILFIWRTDIYKLSFFLLKGGNQ